MRLILCAILFVAVGCGRQERVVLYCAQDRDFAERILGGFSNEFDIRVDSKFDTEATKSVSLIEEIRREANRPRCDVHWNNEILGTIRLQQEGLLEPYRSPMVEGYPEWSKAKDGTWQAFAARARILIINTELVAESDRPTSIYDLLDQKWAGKIAMAKPMFGTTATHAACLFEALGEDRAKEFFRRLQLNGVNIVAGNKQVAEGVGAGRFAVGLTDTDDAMLEVKANHQVAIVFPDRDGHADHPNLGTLFIPNTVAIIKGAPHPEAARKLVDFLLRPETERHLAEGGGHQIPLNPNVDAELPAELVTPAEINKVMSVDFVAAASRWDEVQAFLRQAFAR